MRLAAERVRLRAGALAPMRGRPAAVARQPGSSPDAHDGRLSGRGGEQEREPGRLLEVGLGGDSGYGPGGSSRAAAAASADASRSASAVARRPGASGLR